MKFNKNFIYESLAYKYFGKDLFKNKDLRDTLLALEELLIIKKNIRKIFNTDNPGKIEQLIGNKINNVIIQSKDAEYSKLIDDTYKKTHEHCKLLLGATVEYDK